jgi:general secretion pathway protein M
MIERFRIWFDGRSRREKWLVLVMLGLLAVTLVWGLSRPIDEALSSARQRNADSAIRLAQTRAQVEAVRTLRRIRPQNAAGPIEAIVRQSATAAGLTLDSVIADGAGLRVHINSARGGALLSWIGGLEGQGVLVDRLSITDSGNRTVAADISFRMAAS